MRNYGLLRQPDSECDIARPAGRAMLVYTETRPFLAAFGGDGGIRTPDLYSAIVALSQLSYVPVSGLKNTPPGAD